MHLFLALRFIFLITIVLFIALGVMVANAKESKWKPFLEIIFIIDLIAMVSLGIITKFN